MNWGIALFLVLLSLVLAAFGASSLDRRDDERTWRSLIKAAGSSDATFDPAMVAGLPEPARRYFLYTIRPGARLHRAVEIEMTGELGFGDKEKPNYQPMSARQILAPPYGLVWKLKAGPVSGSDGANEKASWTRFWLYGVLPIVRVGGDEDHRRSAFGRVVAEGAFWAPASLLPGEHVRWEAIDATQAGALVEYGGLKQAVDIAIAEDGRPARVVISRWSNANPDKAFREQPFGGDLSDFREFEGHLLPTHVEGGNHIGTDDYFPFYKADVTAIRFPQGEPR